MKELNKKELQSINGGSELGEAILDGLGYAVGWLLGGHAKHRGSVKPGTTRTYVMDNGRW
tara:strand:+ start:4580 stop:4759 length:180 start_codon:yes stop_codon:yes gene_type:complete